VFGEFGSRNAHIEICSNFTKTEKQRERGTGTGGTSRQHHPVDDMFHVIFVYFSPDLDGYGAPRMKHGSNGHVAITNRDVARLPVAPTPLAAKSPTVSITAPLR
jgi:hypothetical protein